MPESSGTTHCTTAAPLQSRQSLKNVGGCMGVFSHMFQLNKMLGGSNKFLATSDSRAYSQGPKTACTAVKVQSSLKGDHSRETEAGIDLRKILDVKQEPFVLQDVIWEKRHPMRTQSSRDLNFELIEVPRKSHSSKKGKSRENKKRAEEDWDDLIFATSQGSAGSSSALVVGSQIPAESIVALPSNQASSRAKKTRPSSSKSASTGISPVKSPNKRVLLMEAATRILEGSNRRASKVPSSSVRSLLREIDGSKHAHESSKSKGSLPRNSALEVDFSDKQKSPSQKDLASSEKKQREGKQHLHSNSDRSFSFKQLQQSFYGSLIDSSDMPDDEVLMILQSRISPSGESSSAAGVSSQLAATADNHAVGQQADHVQRPDNHLSGADSTGEETFITLVNAASACNDNKESFLRAADAQTHWDMESAMDPEIVRRNFLQPDMHTMKEKIEDLDTATYTDSCTEVPEEPEFVDSPLRHCESGISTGLHGFLISDIDCSVDAAKVATCETSIGDVDAVLACTISGLDSDGPVKPFSNNLGTSFISNKMECEGVEITENVPAPLLLLCNYSWWTGERIQVEAPIPAKDETSNNCAAYGSPIATTKVPYSVKFFEERKQVENLEEEESMSPDHSYTEEFQQSSPVSVLDPVYDGPPVLCKPFDYFDEARQKLLESVRRYEMLANMDLDMLIKINEENLYDEFEEESDASSFNEPWGVDVADMCTMRSSHVPLMGSPDYAVSRYDGGFSNVQAGDLSLDSIHNPLQEAAEGEFYIPSDRDLYTQHWQEHADNDVSSAFDFIMDARKKLKAEAESRCKALLDNTSEESGTHASTGPTWQSSSQTVLSSDPFGEVKAIGLGIVHAIIQKELKASSWSSFTEEVEVMELELESSLYAALMQELLCDLLH